MFRGSTSRVVFLCTFPPGANLEIEGLGRYFGSLLSESASLENDFRVVVATYPWHRKWASTVCEGTEISVETYRPKNVFGVMLSMWSFRRIESWGFKQQAKSRILSKQALVHNIHLLSVKTLPSSLNKKKFYRILLPILTFFSKALLYVGIKLFKSKKSEINYSIELQKSDGNKGISQDYKRVLFDLAMKKVFEGIARKYSKQDNIIVTMNNRFSLKNYSKSVMLVPDVIPITLQDSFASDNSRWNYIIDDIRIATLNSKRWITFSEATEAAARLGGVVKNETEINVIPHASFPPGMAYKDYEMMKSKGLHRQWIDYHWRTGQENVTNDLFKSHTFNNNLKYIIYPTQLRPHKNIEMLIESWQKVVSVYPAYKLVLTLDITRHPELNGLVRDCGISNSVIFIPKLTDSELIAWEARADFVLSVSAIEGAMPFMVSESTSVGVPFLVPALGVTREILPEIVLTASSLEIDSSDSLAASLINAIPRRNEILRIQKEWSKVYSRSWSDVWKDWILVIERTSKT